jgi:hypothetical protein
MHSASGSRSPSRGGDLDCLILELKALISFKTLVTVHQAIQRNFPEDPDNHSVLLTEVDGMDYHHVQWQALISALFSYHNVSSIKMYYIICSRISL